MSAHFERVTRRYADTSSSGGDSDWQAIPDSEFEQNELTAALRR